MTLDLTAAVPDTLILLGERGKTATVTAVLETLGVELAPTLSPSGSLGARRGQDSDLVSLGRFQLLGELGRGGMGRVLEARDPEIRRSVAVKVVIDPTKVTAAQLSRFVAEAQITGQLQHPNIVPVYDIGVTERGEVYFVMKRVEGRSLRQVLIALGDGDEATAEVWGRHRLLTAFIQVCHAVAYAHDRGVLHRDLKPDNVMLGPFGEVLLMDWGVARLMGDATETLDHEDVEDERVEHASRDAIERLTMAKTMDGVAIGTPGFMSPEQVSGDLLHLDGRSDVWSLGAILYELLTLQSAYEAPSVYALMFAAAGGPPTDPRERAPSLNIPVEIAEVCLRAMSHEREDRFATASELADSVEAFLAGSKRREAALRHVAEAEAVWARYGAMAAERAELLAKEKALDEALDPWASLEEKAELLAVRQRIAGIDPDRIMLFSEVLTLCDKALSQDPNNVESRMLLARVHYARFEEAEAARDERDRLFHAQRVREYDDGRHATMLRGTGALTLRTDPPGAEVVCERYDRSAPLVWPLVERRVLGTTPLERAPLEQGSYLLTIRSAGRRDTRYPVFIPRGRHWDSGEAAVPLYSDADIGAGMVYVPPGPFVCGGDEQAQDSMPAADRWVAGFFVSVLPVTMQQYCAFINDLAERAPEAAWSRVPRHESGVNSDGGQYWVRPAPGEPYSVPEVDRDGDRWDPLWSVSAVSWQDAMAYAAWRSERDGLGWRLPREQQWEKASRGADGRIFPWGHGFDPTLCKMRLSRAGRPQPERVGAFATDASPYGARDLAGSTRDWCGDAHYGGDPTCRPVRGGSWNADARACRTGHRNGLLPWYVLGSIGLRLARDAAPSGCLSRNPH